MRPSEELYVQQLRQIERNGAQVPRRRTDDPLALDQTRRVQPKVTASYHSLMVDDRKLPQQNECQRCGHPLNDDLEQWRLKRRVWLPDGQTVSYWLCQECAG
jgi:hypothetical protein